MTQLPKTRAEADRLAKQFEDDAKMWLNYEDEEYDSEDDNPNLNHYNIIGDKKDQKSDHE